MSSNSAQPNEGDALDELAVWEAFRGLRLDGATVHERLPEYLRSSGALDAPGDTLEVGVGDAHLWRTGGAALLDAILARGELVLTDADPAHVERCRGLDVLRRDGISMQIADARSLPFSDRRFARVVVTHVLHWCGPDEGVRAAVAELARVLAPGGRALVITVDERVHMTEVYALLQRAAANLESHGVAVESMPSASPRVLPFCAGNAEAFLRERFASVERVDCDYAHVVDPWHAQLGVPAEAFMVRYLYTLPFLKAALRAGRVPNELFDEIRALLRAELDARGEFRMSRRDVIYDCAGRRDDGKTTR